MESKRRISPKDTTKPEQQNIFKEPAQRRGVRVNAPETTTTDVQTSGKGRGKRAAKHQKKPDAKSGTAEVQPRNEQTASRAAFEHRYQGREHPGHLPRNKFVLEDGHLCRLRRLELQEARPEKNQRKCEAQQHKQNDAARLHKPRHGWGTGELHNRAGAVAAFGLMQTGALY